jgi:ATP-dependent Clp protease ATP-binding subunit ClpA
LIVVLVVARHPGLEARGLLGRDEANAGDVFAAILQQPKSHAAQLLAAQGITRLDILNYISHGVRKGPARETEREGGEPADAAPPHRQCRRRVRVGDGEVTFSNSPT